MAIRVVESPLRTVWIPVNCGTGPSATTVYNNSLVYVPTDGAKALIAAVAKPEIATAPFGVVLGNNNRTPLFNSTYNAEYIASVITQADLAARDFFGVEGMTAKSEQQAMVKIAVINTSTVLEADIRGATINTAPEVVTCTTVSSDGLTGMVHSALSWTTTANQNTYYCRSGANLGFYRTSYAASTTTPTFYNPWPYDWAVGDTYVVVPVAIGGSKYLEFYGGLALWVSSTDDLTHAFECDVISMNLKETGKCTVQFSFARKQLT